MLVDVFGTKRLNAIAQRARGIVYKNADLSAVGFGAVEQLLRRLGIGKIQFKTFGADLPGRRSSRIFGAHQGQLELLPHHRRGDSK